MRIEPVVICGALDQMVYMKRTCNLLSITSKYIICSHTRTSSWTFSNTRARRVICAIHRKAIFESQYSARITCIHTVCITKFEHIHSMQITSHNPLHCTITRTATHYLIKSKTTCIIMLHQYNALHIKQFIDHSLPFVSIPPVVLVPSEIHMHHLRISVYHLPHLYSQSNNPNGIHVWTR
jgi:hypothetical protein